MKAEKCTLNRKMHFFCIFYRSTQKDFVDNSYICSRKVLKALHFLKNPIRYATLYIHIETFASRQKAL